MGLHLELRLVLSYKNSMWLNFLMTICIVVLLVWSGAAHGEDTAGPLVWMVADAPPLRIADGPWAGRGHADLLHALLRGSLTDQRHAYVTANMRRILNALENGESVLAVDLVPGADSEGRVVFSVPCVVLPPVCLVLRVGDKRTLGVSDSASLREFVATHSLGVAARRIYGGEVDEIVRHPRVPGRLVTSSGSRLLENQLEMLRLGRLDGVLAYPVEVNYLAGLHGNSDWYRLVSLREAKEAVAGCVAAPRTAWGAAMIRRINSVLLQHRADPELVESLERWLPPECRCAYRAMCERVFGKADVVIGK